MRLEPSLLRQVLKKTPTKGNNKTLNLLDEKGNFKTQKLPKKNKAIEWPEWLREIIYSDKEIMIASLGKRHTTSPHQSALIKLVKDPTLYRSGKQEHYLQVVLFYLAEIRMPEMYKLMSTTPNGGLRNEKVGGELKSEGQKKGYPDISVDSARGGYFGLRIEVKTAAGVLTREQRGWLDLLSDEGYLCCVAYDFEECWNALIEYWSLTKNTRPHQKQLI